MPLNSPRPSNRVNGVWNKCDPRLRSRNASLARSRTSASSMLLRQFSGHEFATVHIIRSASSRPVCQFCVDSPNGAQTMYLLAPSSAIVGALRTIGSSCVNSNFPFEPVKPTRLRNASADNNRWCDRGFCGVAAPRLRQPLLNLVSRVETAAHTGSTDEIRLHPIVPSRLPHPSLRTRMPAVKDIVYSIPIRFDLALNCRRELPVPLGPLF